MISKSKSGERVLETGSESEFGHKTQVLQVCCMSLKTGRPGDVTHLALATYTVGLGYIQQAGFIDCKDINSECVNSPQFKKLSFLRMFCLHPLRALSHSASRLPTTEYQARLRPHRRQFDGKDINGAAT